MSNKKTTKNNKKVKKEEEPAPDLLNIDGATLMNMIYELKDRTTELQTKRNFVQNERDLLENFSNTTKGESDDLKLKLSNQSTAAEVLENDHRVEVKVYLQKVKHLEYDQKLNRRHAQEIGDRDMKIEDGAHNQRSKDMQKSKTDEKKQYTKNDEVYQGEIRLAEQHQKKTMKMLETEYDRKIRQLEEKYEETLIRLRSELELKLKVEIHEIEERKNQHINELIRNHEAAFAELKSYYNEITVENLTLIKSQKERIEELQTSLISNGKLITEIKAKNKEKEEPLERNRKLRDDLKYALRLHAKDKMAISNLKIKLRALGDKIYKTEREQDLIDQRYTKVIHDKRELENRFERVTNEFKMHCDAKNIALSRKLGNLSEKLEQKETQLQHLIKTSNIESTVVNDLCSKIQENMEAKTSMLKTLQYSINHATKAYNDAIRVYESKLVDFGIPADELGFQLIDTKTSLIPAGLVSS